MQHCMIRTLRDQREGSFLHLTKSLCEAPTESSMGNGERLNARSLRQVQDGNAHSTAVLATPARATGQKRKSKPFRLERKKQNWTHRRHGLVHRKLRRIHWKAIRTNKQVQQVCRTQGQWSKPATYRHRGNLQTHNETEDKISTSEFNKRRANHIF